MSLIITGVIDGPLPGGLPKAVELFVTASIADLSTYGVGFANNGGGTDGEEFTFPAEPAAQGSYIYVASEAVEFANFFGFAPTYTSGLASINGDDAIELFENGTVIDRYGDPDLDGSGLVWDHLDSWASRNPGTAANPTFDPADWTIPGINALDGETANASAATPFPVAAYSTTTPPPPQTPAFVINELDADTPSIDMAEFVEIYDGGVGNSSLDGVSLVLFNGNGDAEYRTVDLTGQSTDANGFFVVGTADVPNVDLAAFPSNALQNGADAAALYTGTPPSAPTTTNLIDAVVYGTNDEDDAELLAGLGLTTQFNESANGMSDVQSLSRSPDGTGAFVAQAPTPGETNVIPEPPAVSVLIHEIQGAVGTGNLAQITVDDVSPLEGAIVSIEAIVTADFQDGVLGSMGDLNGFYVQEEDAQADGDLFTSEGIFIFDGSAPAIDVAIGDLVQITGTVSENFGETQISASDVSVVSSGNLLPTATTVTFPTASVALDDGGNYVANLEAYEGMLVNIPQDMVITELFNLDRFGQYNVSAERLEQFSQNNAPSVAGNDAHLQNNAKSTVVLDDGASTQNPATITVIDGNDGVLANTDTFRMGDTIGDTTGVLAYSFDEFRIQNGTGNYTAANPREDAPADIGGNFKVASLNVLNYFTTIDASGVTTDNGSDPRGADTQEEFDRQAVKMIEAITAIDADIIGLIELENDFAGDNFAIKDIVDRVNADLGATVYAFVDPGQEFIGGDAIANGLIYKVDNVAPLGDMAILETFNGQDFEDPLGAGRPLNRPAIAQSFTDLNSGETLTVSVNHLKSKGSLSGLAEDEAQGDGQGNNNATRAEAANILADWLASDPTGQGSENTLILGDLNAYASEDPVTNLEAAGYTDLAEAVLGDAAYSYVFDGQIGTLDYALANDALAGKLAGATEWHINSDEADAFDYNLDFGRDPALFDGATPARNSDHDPVIVSFNFEPELILISGTDQRDFLKGTDADERIEGLAGNDVLRGRGGDDLIIGGDGNDWIWGQKGDDTIEAGIGNDKMFGGQGDDLLIAGSGQFDRLFGGQGADTFLFSAEIANDSATDRHHVFDFNANEDVVDLGGAVVENAIGRFTHVVLELAGGQDKVVLFGVNDFNDITFVNDPLLVG